MCCRCDNTRQCVDGSDERNCTAGEACAEGKYACRTGLNVWEVSFILSPGSARFQNFHIFHLFLLFNIYEKKLLKIILQYT